MRENEAKSRLAARIETQKTSLQREKTLLEKMKATTPLARPVSAAAKLVTENEQNIAWSQALQEHGLSEDEIVLIWDAKENIKHEKK